MADNWCEQHLDETAKREGWEVLRAGWPDRVLVKDGKVLFVEVKRKGDPIRDSQLKMFTFLRMLGFPVYVAVYGELSNLLTIEEYQSLTVGHDTKRIQEEMEVKSQLKT